jgi:hypothetical protein
MTAACAGQAPKWDEDADYRKAKAICRRCTMTAECLQLAFADPSPEVFPRGVWAGLSGRALWDLRPYVQRAA